jgi:hypothetical protein
VGQKSKLAVFVFILVLLAAACSGRRERLVRETVAANVEEFRKKEQAKCRATLLTEAGQTADSLLLYEALSEVNDSLAGRRPFRPARPGQIAPIDSAAVRPIFE